MAKAYLATSGSYSDFRVQRVFLDEELANKYRNEGLCEEIAEFEITDTEVKSVSILHMQWISAHQRPNGPVEAGEWSYVDHVEYAGQPPCKHSIHHLQAGLVGSARTVVAVEGHDSERVRKVFSEQVAVTKAQLAEPGAGETSWPTAATGPAPASPSLPPACSSSYSSKSSPSESSCCRSACARSAACSSSTCRTPGAASAAADTWS